MGAIGAIEGRLLVVGVAPELPMLKGVVSYKDPVPCQTGSLYRAINTCIALVSAIDHIVPYAWCYCILLLNYILDRLPRRH